MRAGSRVDTTKGRRRAWRVADAPSSFDAVEAQRAEVASVVAGVGGVDLEGVRAGSARSATLNLPVTTVTLPACLIRTFHFVGLGMPPNPPQ